MARLSRILVPLVLGLSCLAGGLLVRAIDPGFAMIVRERVFDLYQRVDPPVVGPELPIRIIDVDDASLASLGQWPWPRTLLADMVTTLHRAGAAVIAFDMLFPEPDRASPLSAIEGLALPPDVLRQLRAALAGSPTNDEVFALALGSAPTVLGVAPTQGDSAFASRAGLSMVGPTPARHLTRTSAIIGNVAVLEEAVQGLGGIHVSARDDDAVVRRIPVLTSVGDETSPTIMPSMFVEALRVAQGAQSLVVRTNPAPGAPETGIPQDLRVGELIIPLTETGAYRVRYGTLDPAITLPASAVLQARDTPGSLAPQLEGTIVLIGTSAPGLFDLRATPLGTIVPGVTMHAQAIANVIAGTHLARPDWTLGLELLLMALAGFLVIAAALTLRPFAAALLAAATFVALGIGSWWAFSVHLLLVDASFPIALTLLIFGAVTVPVLVGTDQRQRFIRNAFAHYLAEPVLARLENNPKALKLEGERRTITILFMDIRGFTSRAEHMEPTDAVDLLNALLDPLSEAVLNEEGTIDKFMGDGMMAFWNAPLDQEDHATRAVRAGLAMNQAITDYNASHGDNPQPLAIGVGIHTGEAFVGNMGSKRRFAYSAIGDAVNLAARVEALTSSQNHKMLITQETLDAARTHDAGLAQHFASAGDHTVKGRSQPVTVYALSD
ncbi:MAG: adenylate/guanylate cyclase domain-containing protein [Hyphomicrobiales bacterium]|jgi:adenylate cyclase